MAMYLIFDPTTGTVSARATVSDDSAYRSRPDAMRIDLADYDSSPELWAEVDKATKKLRARAGHQDPRKNRP